MDYKHVVSLSLFVISIAYLTLAQDFLEKDYGTDEDGNLVPYDCVCATNDTFCIGECVCDKVGSPDNDTQAYYLTQCCE